MTSNVIFRGASSEECENFLAVVHQKALEEAKYLDDKWITFYAESLLREDALVFYESLDTKTKASWAAVRTAFVDRYVRRPDGTPYPSASTPTPAAASPNTAQPLIGHQKGRIAILRDNREKLYLSAQLIKDSSWNCLKMCESSSDAQIVSFTVSGIDSFELYAGDNSSNDTLCVTWPSLHGDGWLLNMGSISCVIPSGKKGPGVAQSKVWGLSNGNSLVVQFSHSGGNRKLEPVENGEILHLVQDASSHFVTDAGKGYRKARLAFEPV